MISITGYLAFLRGQVGITPFYLPDDSPIIAVSYAIAKDIVNPAFAQISCIIYDQCVYNLATDTLLNFAQDQSGQTYFADLRAQFHINSFVPGVITESHDESTGQTLAVPNAIAELSLSNLQNLKTPYGRMYLQYAQQYGSLWAVA